MEYKWEQKVPKRLFKAADEALGSKHFAILGIAVANVETGEAAFLPDPTLPKGGVIMADLLQDVTGDVTRIYNEAVAQIFNDGETK